VPLDPNEVKIKSISEYSVVINKKIDGVVGGDKTKKRELSRLVLKAFSHGILFNNGDLKFRDI